MELKLKKINLSSVDELQSVFEQAPQYTFNIDGINYVPSDSGHSALEALPPNVNYGDKYVFLVKDGDENIGAIDLINGYPNKETAYIGLLLLCETKQGRGIGGQVYYLLEKFILENLKLSKIRLSFVESNPVRKFWEKMGFQCTGEIKKYEGKSNRSFAHIMEKVIDISKLK